MASAIQASTKLTTKNKLYIRCENYKYYAKTEKNTDSTTAL